MTHQMAKKTDARVLCTEQNHSSTRKRKKQQRFHNEKQTPSQVIHDYHRTQQAERIKKYNS